MNNIEYFSKLPNKLLLPLGEEEKSIFQLILDDKVILVLDYLYINTNRIDESIFSINNIVTTYNFKIDLHKNKINDKIRCILKKLNELKVIEIYGDIEKIKNNDFAKCKILIDLENNFFILKRNELKSILEYKNKSIDNMILLKLFCYLKARIYKRENKKELYLNGGKAETCYPSYSKIYNDINISEGIINKYINILVELNLIRYDNAGVYYHKSNIKIKQESPNTYALYDKEGYYKDELKESIKFFRSRKENEGYIFVKNKKNPYKNNNRKLNGELGALTKLKNQGKATNEQLKRIEEIKSIIENNK